MTLKFAKYYASRLVTRARKERVVASRHKAGNTSNHHDDVAKRLVANSRPQLGISGGRPTPRNDSVVSSVIMVATLKGHAVRIGPHTFGKM